ncbi:MAG: DUF4870 domain-containing protein [Gammaproteobacteria bacterium]|nr:DUF4870 domain-containing protein [Gammaproteobacteria bacterium]
MTDKDKKDIASEDTTEKVEKAEEVVEEARAESQAEQERVIEGEAEVLGAESASSNERTWSMAAHLSALIALVPIVGWLGMIIGPLVIWLFKKDESVLIAENAKEALNFNITMFIGYITAVVLCITIIGLIVGVPMLIALPVLHLVFIIIAAVKSNDGEAYKYPYTLKLFQ